MSLEYLEKLGEKISECSCDRCQRMCHAPCCGSVEDMEKIMDAGYAKRLMFDDLPSIRDGGDFLKPALKGYEGERAPWHTESLHGCTFWKGGKCELHKRGLKPIQGKIAHHNGSKASGEEYAAISKADWESERGLACIYRWKKEVGYKESDDPDQ